MTGSIRTLEPFLFSATAICQNLKYFTKGWVPGYPSRIRHETGIPRDSLCCQHGVSSCLPQRFGFGFHVQVHQLFNDVVQHAHQFLCCRKITGSCQPTSCTPVYSLSSSPPNRSPPACGLPLFLNFPQHMFSLTSQKHQSLHTTLADTNRIPELRLAVFEARRPRTSCISANKAPVRCTLDTRRGKNL